MYLNQCCDNHTSPILNAKFSVFDVRFKNWGVLLGYILQFYLGDLSHGTRLVQSGARKNISCIMMGFILEVYL